MATFDFHRVTAGINVDSLKGTVFSYNSLKALTVTDPTVTSFALDPIGPIEWRYAGSDFKYRSGDPIKGVIESIQVVAPGIPEVTFKITGISLDIASLRSVLKSSNTIDDALLVASIFNGDDTFKGSRGADKFFGLNGNDSMLGSDGKDTLTGGAGLDTLAGGKGNDKLTGGADSDTFRFDTNIKVESAPNVDKVKDFDAAQDKIQIDDAYFAGFAVGALADAAFAIGAPGLPKTPGARIVYDDDTGDLYYDAPGGKPMYKFAHLTGAPVLTAEHFEIV